MVIWRSYAELDNGKKRVEILWDSEREVGIYFNSLRNYTRCNYVAVFRMESQLDHAIRDVGCILEYDKNGMNREDVME